MTVTSSQAGHGHARLSDRVLVVPDKFKGSADATTVARHLATGFRHARIDAQVIQLPIADGGEGTVDAAVAAGFERRTLRVSGPLGESVAADYAVRGRTAVIEMAQAAGLHLLPEGKPAPLHAGTEGVGMLIAAALDAGADTVVLGAGGSATTDGGAGMLTGPGVRLLDADDRQLSPGGAALAELSGIEMSALHPGLDSARVILASDVDNPLLGPHGAAAVYGPQKGADRDQTALLDHALAHFVTALARRIGERAHTSAREPGAGAAGGLGFAAMAVLQAQRRPGIDVMLDLLDFDSLLDGANLVITGEGSVDEQSLRGKAPIGVARRAARCHVPTVAVCGTLGISRERALSAGFAGVYALTDIEHDPASCMRNVGPLLERTAEIVAAGRHLGPAADPAPLSPVTAD